MQRDLSSLMGNGLSLPMGPFALNLLLAAVLAWLLGWVYARYGKSLSNRRIFAHNFLLLTLTTTLIISIVKSSLALSLGLVGALSIVRFRAAIKEPEELAYLFLAISIGLGLGAGQPKVTVAAFGLIVAILALRHRFQRVPDQPTLHLTIATAEPGKIVPSQILELLAQCGGSGSLRRFDEGGGQTEVALAVSFKEVRAMEQFTARLRGLGDGVRFSYIEDRGLTH